MLLACRGHSAHKSLGPQETKALRELFVSLPPNCTEADLSTFLTDQCHVNSLRLIHLSVAVNSGA